jgi:hypothetical protein
MAVPAQTWPCGWGFDAPISEPRFSNTWTHGYVRPSSAVCSAHIAMIARTSAGDIRAIVRSCRGEKQSTRHVPRSPSARRRPSENRESSVDARSAAKSLSNTNVVS